MDEDDAFLGYELYRSDSDDPYDHINQRRKSEQFHSEDLRSHESRNVDEKSVELSGKLRNVYALFSKYVLFLYSHASIFFLVCPPGESLQYQEDRMFNRLSQAGGIPSTNMTL